MEKPSILEQTDDDNRLAMPLSVGGGQCELDMGIPIWRNGDALKFKEKKEWRLGNEARCPFAAVTAFHDMALNKIEKNGASSSF